jgi:hypothetical protein
MTTEREVKRWPGGVVAKTIHPEPSLSFGAPFFLESGANAGSEREKNSVDK